MFGDCLLLSLSSIPFSLSLSMLSLLSFSFSLFIAVAQLTSQIIGQKQQVETIKAQSMRDIEALEGEVAAARRRAHSDGLALQQRILVPALSLCVRVLCMHSCVWVHACVCIYASHIYECAIFICSDRQT